MSAQAQSLLASAWVPAKMQHQEGNTGTASKKTAGSADSSDAASVNGKNTDNTAATGAPPLIKPALFYLLCWIQRVNSDYLIRLC